MKNITIINVLILVLTVSYIYGQSASADLPPRAAQIVAKYEADKNILKLETIKKLLSEMRAIMPSDARASVKISALVDEMSIPGEYRFAKKDGWKIILRENGLAQTPDSKVGVWEIKNGEVFVNWFTHSYVDILRVDDIVSKKPTIRFRNNTGYEAEVVKDK